MTGEQSAPPPKQKQLVKTSNQMASNLFTGTYFSRVGKDISNCNGDLSCALREADLNFRVGMEPVRDIRGNTIANAFNVARLDNGNSLGVMGNRYTPTQAQDAFRYLDAMPGKANFRRGGLLKGGRFFLSAEFETFNASGDLLTAFGVFLSSFDGTWANRVVWVLGRHSCANICRFMHGTHADGVTAGRAGRAAKHTQNHDVKLDGFIVELAMAQASTERSIARLSDIRLDASQFSKVVASLLPNDSTRSENMREEIAAYFTRADLGIHGRTAWDAFNAFSAYDTHAATRRATSGGTAEENAFDALLSGRGYADKALPVLLALN